MTRYKSDAERHEAIEKHHRLFKAMQERPKKTQKPISREDQTQKELEEDSREDSEGDGLMSEGGIMFPEEDE